MQTTSVAVKPAEQRNAEQIREHTPYSMYLLNRSVENDDTLITSQTVPKSSPKPSSSSATVKASCGKECMADFLKLENKRLYAVIERLERKNAHLNLAKQQADQTLQNIIKEEMENRKEVEVYLQKMKIAPRNLLHSEDQFKELAKSLEEQLVYDEEERMSLSAQLHRRNQSLRDLIKRFNKKKSFTDQSVQVDEVKAVSPKKLTHDFGQDMDCQINFCKASCTPPAIIQLSDSESD